MEPFLLGIFLRQIEIQVVFFSFASGEMNEALAQGDTRRVFYIVQNMLNAAANISKILWGTKNRQWEETKLRRLPLRELLSITDDSPLLNVRMRNHFEHMDERIEEWWKSSPRHSFVDCNVGLKIAGASDSDCFRNFFPQTGELVFWGDRFNLQDIHKEIVKISEGLQIFTEKEAAEEAKRRDLRVGRVRNAPND